MKKQILRLDPDPLPGEDDNLAYLFFHTTVPGYALADDLNHLYGLALTRQNDLPVDGQQWPLYTYRDNLRQTDYYLIERPVGNPSNATHWAPGHKLLLLQGENANHTANHICNQFNTPLPSPDPSNPSEAKHIAILDSYQQTLATASIYNPNTTAPLSKKTLKERTEMEAIFAQILDNLDLSSIE